MDLTALLRHIKLEPFIGTGAAPAPPGAATALTDAPVAAPTPGAAAEAQADATAPGTAGMQRAPLAAAYAARLAAGAAAVESEENTPASAYTRISPNANALARLVQSAQQSRAPMPPLMELNVAISPPAQVAQSLNASLSQSGLFYESHLQQWVTGDRSLAALHIEPHNRFTTADPAKTAGGGFAKPTVEALVPPMPGAPQAEIDEASLRLAAGAATLPETVQPIVREQLDAMDFQRIVWHGEVWPRQQAELEIREDRYNPQGGGEEEQAKTWLSTLRIELPGLGLVIAQVNLDDEGARISLRAQPAAIRSLQAGGEDFRGAMAAAGIALRQLDISAAAEAEDGNG